MYPAELHTSTYLFHLTEKETHKQGKYTEVEQRARRRVTTFSISDQNIVRWDKIMQ